MGAAAWEWGTDKAEAMVVVLIRERHMCLADWIPTLHKHILEAEGLITPSGESVESSGASVDPIVSSSMKGVLGWEQDVSADWDPAWARNHARLRHQLQTRTAGATTAILKVRVPKRT